MSPSHDRGGSLRLLPRTSSSARPRPGRGRARSAGLRPDEVESIGQIGSYSFDIALGRWTSSRGLDAIFGIEPTFDRSFAGWASLIHPADREAMVAYFTDEVVGRGRPFDRQYRIIRADTGAERWVHGLGAVVVGESGRPAQMMGTIGDITERVAAEEERTRLVEGLRQSERNLAEAQRMSHIGSWERDLVTGALRWSDESHRMFGIEPGTFAGTLEAYLAFVHPEDRRKAAPNAADLASSDPQGVDYRIIRADGSVRTLHEEARVIRDATGIPIRYTGTTQDITERVAADAQRSRLTRLLDGVSSEIYVFDSETLHFTEANAGALHNLGYSLDELRELTPLDLKPSHTQASFAELIAPLAMGERDEVAFSTIHRRKDGSTYPVEVRLDLLAEENPPVFVAIIQDITERVAADAERNRLVSAVEQTADAIWMQDLDGIITYTNRSFNRAYGYESGEIVGQHAGVVDSGSHGPAFFAEIWAAVAAGESWMGSIVNRRKDGTKFEVAAVISGIWDANGHLVSYVQTDRDVTHERALENAIESDIRARESIEASLERIDPTASVESIAAAACAEIARLPGVVSGWALEFVRGRGQVLAAEGVIDSGLSVGQLIPDVRAEYLMERAAHGPWTEPWEPWTEPWEPRPEFGAPRGRIAPAGLRGLAFAPLKGSHGVLGVLALGTTETVEEARLFERLPALATFASILGALVAPGLEARHREGAARADIRSIIDANAFTPYFQPIVDLHAGAVVGYEALSRFSDGRRPDLVFRLAAQAGLGIELEVATLRAAVETSAALPSEPYLSLNVSPDLIVSGELTPLLAGQARSIVLELTEHVVIEDYATLRSRLKSLDRDARLAVDDAGAGYASLRHILELKPDFVKIDIGLVRGINRDHARQALIAGIGYFALKRNVRLIAEGIETVAELKTLRSLGISHGQGYLLGRPQNGRGTGPWPTTIALGSGEETP